MAKITFKPITVNDKEKILNMPIEHAKNVLRSLREKECYPIINRGKLWYDTLSDWKKVELQTWYKAWLDVTETFVIPTKPSWVK